MTSRALRGLCFEGGFDERDAVEAEARGYRSLVWAEFEDGSRYQVTFYDLTRLAQTLEDERHAGRPFFSEPGLIVVERVTHRLMEAAVRALGREGFFV